MRTHTHTYEHKITDTTNYHQIHTHHSNQKTHTPLKKKACIELLNLIGCIFTCTLAF